MRPGCRFVFYGSGGGGFSTLKRIMFVSRLWWTSDGPERDAVSQPYLYESVSLLQTLPQPALLALAVLSVAPPRSLGLLRLLLLLPQLLVSLSEPVRQRGDRLAVVLLLGLMGDTGWRESETET